MREKQENKRISSTMLPSRCQIQVTLDDTATSRIVQCKPPQQVQVKILRRPKPQAGHDEPPATRQPADRVHQYQNCLDVFEERLLDEPASLATGQEEIKTTLTFAERVRNGNNPASAGSAAPRIDNLQASYPSSSSSFHSDNNNRTKPARVERVSTGMGGDQAGLNNDRNHQPAGNQLDLGKSRRNVLRTYQERVDEYAKARLRILGSAFPDNDDPLTDGDDVNTCA